MPADPTCFRTCPLTAIAAGLVTCGAGTLVGLDAQALEAPVRSLLAMGAILAGLVLVRRVLPAFCKAADSAPEHRPRRYGPPSGGAQQLPELAPPL